MVDIYHEEAWDSIAKRRPSCVCCVLCGGFSEASEEWCFLEGGKYNKVRVSGDGRTADTYWSALND
jgi:hypothetical protein